MVIKKDDILRRLGLSKLLKTPFKDKIEVFFVEKGVTEEMYGFSSGKAWYLAEGRIKGTSYLDSGEIYWEIRGGEWFGLPYAILGSEAKYDLEAISDAAILQIPVKEILDSSYADEEILKAFLRIMALSKERDDDFVLERLGNSDEEYFLKYLIKNDYEIRYKNLTEVSEILNINLRTFQRILARLDEEELLDKKRGYMKVRDRERFLEYLEEITS